MKKIIFLFLILFISILTVKAENTFYLGEKVTDMYIESIDGSDIHNGAPFLLHRGDGSIVYCINPFKMMSTTDTYKSYIYNDSIFNLTDEQLNKLNIIAYFGYGYQNNTDIKWYGITQFLIYKTLGLEDVYFTDAYYGSRVEKYVDEVNELEQLVNNYYKLPSFSNNNYEYDPNTSYELIDTNNVLSDYKIKESNIDASISDNKLIINTGNSGNYNITFVKKSPITRDYILYSLDGAQSLIYPGKINDITFNVFIEVNSGSITINKFDCNNKERLEATLNESVFGIYNDNVLINKLTVNQTASLSNLPLGNYILKEITGANGYSLDTNVYDINLTKNNKEVIINSCSNVIQGNLVINKYYGSKNEYNLDNEAVFEIYHDNKLIVTLNNQKSEKLEYGTYLIKQISGKKYYDLIENFTISIKENKDYTYDFYTEKTDEIKAYEELLKQKEELLNKKEEELVELKNKLEQNKNDLIDLKNEINQKQEELDNKKSELQLKEDNLNSIEEEILKEKERLEKLKEEVLNDSNLLEKKQEELKQKQEQVDILKKELSESKNQLDKREESLNELENNLKQKEDQLTNFEKELTSLSSKLKEKEQQLNELETSINIKDKQLKEQQKQFDLLSKEISEKEIHINNKEIELQKREEELIKLENKKEDVLVVEVPNTHKKSYNKIISIILMFIGSMFIIYSTKKVTGH